jgi:hypothetical protein
VIKIIQSQKVKTVKMPRQKRGKTLEYHQRAVVLLYRSVHIVANWCQLNRKNKMAKNHFRIMNFYFLHLRLPLFNPDPLTLLFILNPYW